MCKYVEAPTIFPGWACCRCRTYQGFQYPKCRACGAVPHDVETPHDFLRCQACGWGYRPERLEGVKGTLAGQTLDPNHCFACGAELAAVMA